MTQTIMARNGEYEHSADGVLTPLTEQEAADQVMAWVQDSPKRIGVYDFSFMTVVILYDHDC